MTGLVLATLAAQLPAVSDAAGAPEWVHLVPNGVIQGRDGRTYTLSDPSALVADFQANALDLVVDFEHQNDNPAARLSGPVPAAGWIKELQARADGIWGRVEWTARAAELITSKEYRYLSPVILHMPDTRDIKRLKGAGLVHNPNFLLTALASQDAQMTAATPPAALAPGMLASVVARLLGLPADTPPDELAAKLSAKLQAPPDPAKYMPVTAVQEMLAERLSERREVSEGRWQEKVRAAVQSGYITNGMRGWAIDLCRSDEPAFDAFLQKAGPTFAHLSRPAPSGAIAPLATSLARQNESEQETSVCAQLGLKPGALAS